MKIIKEFIMANVKKAVKKVAVTLKEVMKEDETMLNQLENLVEKEEKLFQPNSVVLGKTIYELLDVVKEKTLFRLQTEFIKKYKITDENIIKDLHQIVTYELLNSRDLLFDTVLRTIKNDISSQLKK
jgi:hypothetical protein